MEFIMLLGLDGQMNQILSLLCQMNIQGRDPCIGDFAKDEKSQLLTLACIGTFRNWFA